MAYGLEVTGTDSNGSYVVADTEGGYKPLVVANVGIGTSVSVPASGNYLLFVNQKGLYGSTSGGANNQTATRVTIDTTTNTAYFWYCSNWTASATGMGTTTISASWSNSANCRYIILADNTALNVPAGSTHGIRIADSSGNDIFDSRKITINDSFRILGEYTYTDTYTDYITYASFTVSDDEDMFVEMSPFTETRTNTGGPDTRFVVGPEFTSTEVKYGFSVATQAFGKYYGSFPIGKLLRNPTDITAGKPSGWTKPY